MKWTPEDDQTLRLLWPSMTAKQVAEHMGRTLQSVRGRVAVLKILQKERGGAAKRPIGSESMDRGFVTRKVTDTGNYKKDWKRVYQIEWEEINGPLPPGTMLIRIDKTLPRTPSNLRPLTKRQHWLETSKAGIHAPLGTERIRGGLAVRKIAETGDKRTDWKRVDVILWESVHGPMPPGTILVLKDPMMPHTLENLALLTKQEHMARVSVNNLPPELVELYQIKAQINRRVKGMERKAESEKSEAT